MESVKSLVRYVTRGFYEKNLILIMDALLIHTVLLDDELSHLLGIQRKELRQLCAKLKEDRLLTDHVEKVEGPVNRPIHKTYYYIHYTETIDAIKWKMHGIVDEIKEKIGREARPQGYVCPLCHKQYTSLEAMANMSADGFNFACDVCGTLLQEDEAGNESKANQEKIGRLMGQIQPIIDILKQIDDTFIPENTFESSLAGALPANVLHNVNGGANGMGGYNGSKIKTARAGAGNKTSLLVNITSTQENAEKEREAKKAKAILAQQNALPAWHMESTVGKTLLEDSEDTTGGETTSGDSVAVKSDFANNRVGFSNGLMGEPSTGNTLSAESFKVDSTPAVASTNDTEMSDQNAEDALAAYYAQLEARQQQEDDEEEEDDEDDDDDDDDDEDEEFEDVLTTEATAPTESATAPATAGVVVEEADFDDDDDE
ncbi:hypothetical protein NADFUDRAFT_52313 [Nadsonia fulvescens var. elongata DSM 6958]|uniref:HTH TFE/IIEalpha-type domain-containing protein n=1 Tax=Nadsonia fulvescens var. elongata DSM 6958 TaxID=857566 RepID=A0A1E3PGW8_9ASCO|nr:hypothetical protein NADFUDRAFT_52313 [Nadsonia fulvescens var. elongata DSM 6958]